MAVPKRKTSRARRNKRRGGHRRLNPMAYTVCPNCGEVHIRHTVCPHCGYYRGKQIFETEEG